MNKPKISIWMMIALLTAAGLTLGAAEARTNLESIRLREGFRISLYAAKVPDARSMSMSDNGTLFVGTRRNGTVYAIRDTDNDNKADQIFTIASGLNMPNGVVFF